MSENLAALQQRIADLEQQVAWWRDQVERYREIASIFLDHTYCVRVNLDGSFVREIDRQGLITITGFTEDEIIALDRTGLVHPDDVHILLKRNEPLMAGQSVTDEYRMLTKSGAYLRVRDIAHVAWDAEQGRVLRIYGGIKVIADAEEQADAAQCPQRSL
jgi:PAS domain-containing protein